MTKEQMLASLEAQIRKDIPRLMELREGCKVLEYKRVKIIVSYKNNSLIAVDCLNGGVGFLDKNIYKIIGHDIMLNNVLEWLSYLGFFTECSKINFGGDTFCRRELVYDDDGNFLYEKTTFCEWNLSSPYLKNQSEELIKFLYNLIKE